MFKLQTDAKAFKNTHITLKINSVDQHLLKIQLTDCGTFSQGGGTPGTETDCVFTAGSERVLKM
jgi:hypothetical protein